MFVKANEAFRTEGVDAGSVISGSGITSNGQIEMVGRSEPW